MRRLKSRLAVLCAACVGMLVLAALPRPARRAVPARPVQESGEGRLSGKTILVDAGHGGADGGARARDSGAWEKDVNLQAALALRDALEDAGARVVMTRETDRAYDRNKRKDLTARLELARENRADLLVSVHMNEYRSRKEAGPQVFYRAGQEQSQLLAGAVQDAMNRALRPRRAREAHSGDYFILSLELPSILTEWGFLSNAEEEALLLTPAYRKQAAQAVRDGIIEYFALASGERTGKETPDE